MAKRRTLTLSDPRALRAFAHPARQTIVAELLSGRVLTATEAGELTGLSASAASHHLRALQRWGLAERAEPTGDGRERPWRGTADQVNLRPEPSAAGLAALSPLVSSMIETLRAETSAQLAKPWDDREGAPQVGLSRADLWLTDAEVNEVSAAFSDALERFRDRNAKHHPDGARPIGLTVGLLPAIRPAAPTGTDSPDKTADGVPET